MTHFPDPACEALHSTLESIVGSRGGAALAVRLDGEVWVGAVNVIPGGQPSGDACSPTFLAYSITKSFIAALILQLRDAGRFSLDTPIARWLPGVPHSAAITLRHLLNHTAGIPDYGQLAAYHQAVRTSPSDPWGFDAFAAHTYAHGLLFAPGMGWAYSNPGYMLLKRIAEIETGERLAALLHTYVIRPLGLHDTFVPESVADLHALVSAYASSVSATDAPVDVRAVYHPGWVAHGVVASTPRDIATFYHQLFTDGLLPMETVAEITTLVPVPHAPAQYGRPGYGLGIMGDEASRFGVLWGHNGGGPGYSASAFHAPDLRGRRATVCAMCAIEEDGLAERLVMSALALLERHG